MTSLTDKSMVKLAVETYNKRNPDEDDLNYKWVLMEIKYALKTAQKDLKGYLLDQKIIWHENFSMSDYLLTDGELIKLIDEDDFEDEVFDSVEIITKEN